MDPGNAVFNPANLATLYRIEAAGALGDLVPELAPDMDFKSVLLSGGYQFEHNGSIVFGVAAQSRFAKTNYGQTVGTNPEGDMTGVFESYERYWGGSLAGGATISNMFHVGLGVTFKWWDSTLAPAEFTMERLAGESSTTAWDYGIRVAGEFLKYTGYQLVPALGISYLNAGFPTGSNAGYIDLAQADELPKTLRYGLSVRLATPSSKSVDDMLKTSVPALDVIGNIDVANSRASEKANVYGLGIEAGIYQILFLRLGYVSDKDEDIKDLTYGLGLGVTLNQFQGRLDYARVPQGGRLDEVSRYELSLGVHF
jgi:hypothetical protein